MGAQTITTRKVMAEEHPAASVISQPPENSATAQVEIDRLKAELETARKLLAAKEDEEFEEAGLPTPSRGIAVHNDKRLQDMSNSALDVIKGNFPAPDEIPFDEKNLDGPVVTIYLYEKAATAADEYAKVFAGGSALYRWRIGEYLEKVYRKLSGRGSLWKDFCESNKLEKSAVSRDRLLYKSHTDWRSVLGLSANAVHQDILKQKKQDILDDPLKFEKHKKKLKERAKKKAEQEAARAWPAPLAPQLDQEPAQIPEEKPLRQRASEEPVTFLKDVADRLETFCEHIPADRSILGDQLARIDKLVKRIQEEA